MNTNPNTRHPPRSSRSAVVRSCVAFGMAAASITIVGSMTSATAMFRDPGPGSMGAFAAEAKKAASSDDSVTFPYVASSCFAGRRPIAGLPTSEHRRSASTSTERRRTTCPPAVPWPVWSRR